MTAAAILDALACGSGSCPCARSLRAGKGLTHCVSHPDRTPSLNVEEKNGTTVWNCKAGCEQSAVTADLRARELIGTVSRPAPARIPSRRGPMTDSYDYHDAESNLVATICRDADKNFWVKQGAWPEDKRVLFNLPEVIAGVVAKKTIFVTEGEKDARSMKKLGVVSTTYPFGGGNFLDRYSADLIGANVVVCQDRDEINPRTGRRKGEQAARVVAEKITVAARSVKILEFPGPGKDATDWINSGGTLMGLESLVADTPEWQSGERVAYTSKDLANEMREVIAKRRAGDPSEIGWRIGFGALDKEMVYSPGDVMLVAAATGTGKTSFLQSLERRSAVPTIFFSIEMSRKQLMNRHLAATTGIDSWKIRRGALSDTEYEIILDELDVFERDDNHILIDNPALTTDALEAILRVYCVKRGVRVAYVDHIQRLADKNNESERLRMAGIMKNLSRISRQTETQLVVACQVNRNGDRASGEPPYKSELAESGVLEQEATVILALGRAEGATATKMAVRKNRHGLDGFTIPLVFDLMHNNYMEQSEARLLDRAPSRKEEPEAVLVGLDVIPF